ncbi:MAG: Glu-tRNA(Gln) amidotransferase subunit GatE [Gemmatimonadales bacterium]
MSKNAGKTTSVLGPPSDLNPRGEAALDFGDKDLAEMTPADYAAIGFLSGLEVHQQLITRSKLFCRCPAGRNSTEIDAEVLRHMRPTLSELGEYDGTALMEFKTRKEIVYRLERGSVCTYETDDTPPFEIDDEAVRVAIEIAQLCNLNLISELHVMRKQYLDGSIPTGFQRTAMVGLTGAIPFKVPELGVDRELSIRQLSLEEDSCREVTDIGHRITFRTDRLGMPLTEMVTEPELVTPWELQAAGRLLAAVAQATRKVRRGPGAARQDVNVSVAGGRRVEIKGVDNHRHLPLLVHTEAFRQLNLLRVKAELARRGVTTSALAIPDAGVPWEVSPRVVDAGPALARSDFQPIRDALERGEVIAAVRLAGFAGLLAHCTQPGVTFAREFADRVRVIACPPHRPFMIHSDITDYGLDPRQWRELRKLLQAESDDAVVVVWAPEQDAATAVREVLIRAHDALVGVPSETRQAFRDGTNGFERTLPGADRMYPDTDTPPIPIAETVVAEVRDQLPETPWNREARYAELGLGFSEARRLARAAWADLFDALEPESGEVARRLAASLQKRLPFHRRRGRLTPDAASMPDASRLAPMVRAIESGEIRPEALDRMLDALVAESEAAPDEILARYRADGGDEDVLTRRLTDVVVEVQSLTTERSDGVLRWAMGAVMPQLLGRLDPTVVRERLREAIEDAVPETVA